MKIWFTNIGEAWSGAWKNPAFRNVFYLTWLLFFAVLAHNIYCLRLWESRNGLSINDIVLNQLPPRNFSYFIFLGEYSALLLVIIFTLAAPQRFIMGLQAFAIITLARTFSIFCIALEPPGEMIALYDPVANFLMHSSDIFVTKDLFFSGHISAMALLFLISTNRYAKIYLAIATVAVSIMILWQHVHYTLDVICAPFISYFAYRFVQWLHTEKKFAWSLQEEVQ